MQVSGLQLNKRNWDDFDHARWRVQFLRHLLQMHQTSPKRGSAAWAHDEEEYLDRLEAAEKELARFPEEWQTLPEAEIPRLPEPKPASGSPLATARRTPSVPPSTS